MSWERLPLWFQHGILGVILGGCLLLLMYFAGRILGAKFTHWMHAIRVELRDAARIEWTVGAINLFGFLAVALFGIIVMVSSSVQQLLGSFLMFILPGQPDKGKELIAHSSYYTLFFFLGFVLVISLIAVVIDNRRPRR